MTGLDDAALLAVVAIGSAFAASALGQARWPRRSPAAAILLWQALGLASGLAAVGTLLGLAMPDSTTGVVRSVWYLAALFRTGGPFRGVGAVAAAGGLAAVGALLGLAMPDSTTGVVRSVWYLAALFRTGGPFRVVGAFAAAGTVPVIVVAIRLACLAGGLALFGLLCWVLVAACPA